MLVFIDFEASSLGKRSYPIEVAWVFEDGRSEAHLIRPAPDWTDWDVRAEAIHNIARAELVQDGERHDLVAGRMADVLVGHALFASAPSWDGKWLSALLRAAGYSRHALRLRRSDDAMRESARKILEPVLTGERLEAMIESLIEQSEAEIAGAAPAHRALPDAQGERARWLQVCEVARTVAMNQAYHG